MRPVVLLIFFFALQSLAGAQEPQDPRVFLRRAKALLESGSYGLAAEAATKALELGYDRVSPYNLRSQAYAGEGRYEEALADAEKAVRLHPSGSAGYINRATAKEGLKYPPQDILADYKKASALDARLMLRYAAAMGKYAPGREVAVGKTESVPAKRRKARDIFLGASTLAALGGLACMSVFQWRRRKDKVLRLGYARRPASELAGPRLGAVVGGLFILEKELERREPSMVYEARDLEDRPVFLLRRPRQEAPEARVADIPGLKKAVEEGPYLYLVFEGEENARACLRQMQ
ncbi:MAG: tetratricopeptide repeat protein [Elusimicrobia bacterium]|nr:tetratricopeptide repeat protein [Elusimicrobiota bacterium]